MVHAVMTMFMLFNILGGYIQEMDIIDCLPFCTQIEITYNNQSTSFGYESKEYNDILHSFLQMSQDGHQMPALGVALHEEVIQEKQQGLFVEFIFSGVQLFNKMPFESLLVQIVPDSQGFNLIRMLEGKYQGRCFYYSLADNHTMQELYNTALTLVDTNII